MEQKSFVRCYGLFRGRDTAPPLSCTTVNEFADLLDRQELVEEDLQRFLTHHSEIIAAAFMRFIGFVVPKFAFGNDYISDFVVADWTQFWNLTLVELEPSGVKAFNKSGTPARRLAAAVKQISDWQRWIEKYPSYFDDKIAKYHKQFLADLERMNVNEDDQFMRYLEKWGYMRIYHVVIIGRRGPDFSKDQEDRQAFARVSPDRLRILSYDWLLDVARHHAPNKAMDSDMK